MSETRADFSIEGPVGGGIWWVCRTGIGRSKMFQSKREAEVYLAEVFRKLDTGSDACYSLDMDIENTPKSTQALNLSVRDLETMASALGDAIEYVTEHDEGNDEYRADWVARYGDLAARIEKERQQ